MHRRRSRSALVVGPLCFFAFLTWFAYQSWSNAGTHFNRRESSLMDCDTIHIVSVVTGNNATFGFSVLIKSLLAVRHNPLTLHLLVDEDSELVLSEMLHTWLISGLTYKLYQITDYEFLISWIPKGLASRNGGLFKLLVPQILVDIEKAIVLDTSLLLMDDILPIWKAFATMQANNHLFGLVESQETQSYQSFAISEYLTEWPGSGRIYNTGMIMIDLESLRKSGVDWMSLWKKLVIGHLQTHTNLTLLTDHAIFNALFAENPTLAMKVPCEWSVQSRFSVMSEVRPFRATSNIRMVHIDYNEGMPSFFECVDSSNSDCLLPNFIARTIETNGYHLQVPFTACREMASQRKANPETNLTNGDCDEMRVDARRICRIFPFFFSGRLPKDQEGDELKERDVGITTHLSFGRISQLEQLCRKWDGEGSISAALYISDADVIPLLRRSLLHKRSCLAQSRVHVHLVFQSGTFYPLNHMRNIALKFAENRHVLILDGDFIPSSDFSRKMDYSSLVKSSSQPIALVAPAFEASGFTETRTKNLTKPVLLNYLDRGLAVPFHYKKWLAGHAPTDYSHWRMASTAYRVQWEPEYEPYVVVRLNKSASDRNLFEPRFDERFVGYGKNKCSFVLQLDALGYKFLVDPLVFVIHLPHVSSIDELQFHNPTSGYQTCVNELLRDFVVDLISKHGTKAEKYMRAVGKHYRPLKKKERKED